MRASIASVAVVCIVSVVCVFCTHAVTETVGFRDLKRKLPKAQRYPRPNVLCKKHASRLGSFRSFTELSHAFLLLKY